MSRLGAQLRFLAAKAYRNFDFSQSDNQVSNPSRNGEFLDKSSDATSVKDIPIDFCVDCVKYGVLCDKLGLSSLSAFTQNREIKSTTNSHDDEITLVEDSSNGTNDISDIDVTIVDMNRDSDLSGELGDKDELIKELRLMIKSLHSAYTSGRTELMITIQENSSLELRTVEQQAQIIDLNNKLTKLAHELNTASGSAGRFCSCNQLQHNVTVG